MENSYILLYFYLYSVTPTKLFIFCMLCIFATSFVKCSAYILLKDNENHNHNDSVLHTSSIFMKNSIPILTVTHPHEIQQLMLQMFHWFVIWKYYVLNAFRYNA